MNKLLKHRNKLHLTVRQMSLKLGISIGSLSAFENDKSAMSINMANKISAATKIPAIKLLNIRSDK